VLLKLSPGINVVISILNLGWRGHATEACLSSFFFQLYNFSLNFTKWQMNIEETKQAELLTSSRYKGTCSKKMHIEEADTNIGFENELYG
jgi:hypothetical protein